jgi:hypothetical protein
MTAARLLPAIHKLLDAVTDVEKWAPFLEELAARFHAKGAQIVRVHPKENALAFSALYGFDDVILRNYGADGAGEETALARYADHFVRLMPHDPRVALLQRYPGRPFPAVSPSAKRPCTARRLTSRCLTPPTWSTRWL